MVGRKRRRELLGIYILLLPSFSIFFLYRIIPLGWNLLLSFQKWQFNRPNLWQGAKNYVAMVQDNIFWQSFYNTILYFLGGSLIAIVLAIGIALLVNRPIRGRDIYRSVIFMPYPLTAIAIAIIWKWLYNEKVGLINFVLRSLGIVDQGVPFLQSFDWALPSVIFTSIWQIVGYFMIIILTGLQSIPEELYEAGIVDGTSPSQKFAYITLPLIRSSIFICFVVGIINSFTMFDIIYTMTNGGPGSSTEILVTYIYKNAFTFNRMGYASAITLAMFVFLLFLTWLGNKLSGGEAGAVHYYG
jgi:ABC-type sugar transport system permease subunit